MAAYPPPLFTTCHGQQPLASSQKSSPSLSSFSPPSSPSPRPGLGIRFPSNPLQPPTRDRPLEQRRDHLYRTTEDDAYDLSSQKLHQARPSFYGNHPLNKLQYQQQQQQQQQQQHHHHQTQSQYRRYSGDATLAKMAPLNPWEHERKFVLSSPTQYSRTRKSSADSVNSSRASTLFHDDDHLPYLTTNGAHRLQRKRSHTNGEPLKGGALGSMGGLLELDPFHDSVSFKPGQDPAPSTYETLLKQLAAQRAKLESLNSGAKALDNDISVLDETLEEEKDSMAVVLQDAQQAVDGWKGVWSEYSKCEPVSVLQERPQQMASLIQEMSWLDKKALFEQLVGSCKPRETFQLQHLITSRHGQVQGFDFMEELPSDISKMVMKHLSFVDLASCRVVSQTWRQTVTQADVVQNAIDRYTQHRDNVALENVHGSKSDWNQLCRYYERDLRWRKGKPASIHALPSHANYVTSLKNHQGWMVSGGYDEKVRLWESATGKCVRIWEVGSAVSSVELFVDENMEGGGVVVAAFVDIGLVKVWSLHGPLNMHTLTGHQKGVRALAINERFLITAGFDQTVLVWNWATGRKVASFRAHNEVILSVHLVKNTVFTFCIDATLRVFDIPSRTLLHQTKLFDVQPGSSLQWSCLQDKMLLTATSKKVYVWQLEHLDSQRHQHPNHLSLHSQYRPKSAMAAALEGGISCKGHYGGGENCFAEQDRRSPPWSPSPSTNSLSTSLSRPETPALSSSASTSYSNSGSSYFYPSALSPSASPVVESPLPTADDTSTETRIKPVLTALLSMTTDMWCGKVTRHDPPLLILGSRSSSIKLVTVVLSKDIIDPDRFYDAHHIPLQLLPRTMPIQGMPGGHGRGIMCMDVDADKLVVGCTGGSIHIMNMDPAKRALFPTKTFSAGHNAAVVTLPHLSHTLAESPRSVSPNPPSPKSPGANSSLSSSTLPRKPPAAFRTTTTSVITRPGPASTGQFVLPSPEHSPMSGTIPLILNTSMAGSRQGSKTPMPLTPPSDYREYIEQEVLVDTDDDIHAPTHDHVREDFPLATKETTKASSKAAVKTNSPSKGVKLGQSSKDPLSANPPTATPSVSSLCPAQTLSSLSKYIPGPPARIMMRRRASSNAWAQQASSSESLSNPSVMLIGSRNKSDPDLLASARSASQATSLSISAPLTKGLSKSWTLSSPWNSPSRKAAKNKS